jgi:hypothetical protein
VPPYYSSYKRKHPASIIVEGGKEKGGKGRDMPLLSSSSSSSPALSSANDNNDNSNNNNNNDSNDNNNNNNNDDEDPYAALIYVCYLHYIKHLAKSPKFSYVFLKMLTKYIRYT